MVELDRPGDTFFAGVIITLLLQGYVELGWGWIIVAGLAIGWILNDYADRKLRP